MTSKQNKIAQFTKVGFTSVEANDLVNRNLTVDSLNAYKAKDEVKKAIAGLPSYLKDKVLGKWERNAL